ncbi:MAG TPA: DUF2130 domain-containing protein [Bryobacteraceae bacterium]|nr:DUF2130 domain-containing protein [Bryobacteraceae bacterium]
MKNMAEPTISCPNCRTEIKLTESLAAPLVEATRRDYERRLAQKDAECCQREQAVRQQEASLAEQVRQKLNAERASLIAEESRKAKALVAADLDGRTREIQHLSGALKAQEQKLVTAQQAQLEFLKKERALEDQRRELELTVEKRVHDGLGLARNQARLEAEDQLKLHLLEKQQTIVSMQKQIEDLRRRAEQGSQQLQGEVQELELESLLAIKFPFDRIEGVRKGEHGGDVLQRVCNHHGGGYGTILWEAKRTKNWSDGWLTKLREDQRAAKAEIAVIVSHALPRDVETFELIDGVWVTHPKTMIPVAFSLRQMLVEIAGARNASQGQQTKAEMIYTYLTGPRFRQRVEAMVEAFTGMQKDLDQERKVITKQWAKRQEQIDRVMSSTVGFWGDLQGIAGQTIQEIEGLEMESLSLIA